MIWPSNIVYAVRSLFLKRKLDEQLAEEVRTHVEMATEANLARGMPPDEARYAALREFGNVASAQERARDERGWVWFELFVKETGVAGRSLRRARGFSLAVVATLALCIGPNTAILSALYTFVYKPLPFPEPDRLVSIANVAARMGGAKQPGSVVQYTDFSANADGFESFAYFGATMATLGEDEPVRGHGMSVSAGFMECLGLPLQLGRGFLPEEQQPGGESVVILSHGTWIRRYQADPLVIGREIRLDDEPCTIVGVASPAVEQLFNDMEFFRPRIVGPQDLNPGARYAGSVRLFGRLKSGVGIAAAREQLAVLERNFLAQQASPAMRAHQEASGLFVEVVDARSELGQPVKAPLWLLQGGAALVLLLGCVNVASLLLARASAKRQELAIRHALGAGRGTLLRQMLAESLLLAGLSGVLGVAIALSMLRVMNAHLHMMVRHVPPIVLEPRVIGIVFAVILLLVAVMAAVPFALWGRSAPRPGETSQASVSRRGRRVIGSLVVGQIALALVLLVGAGLLLHSFARVMAVQPGFDAETVVQGRIHLPPARYRSTTDLLAVQDRIMQSVASIPAVESVGLSADFPVKEKFGAVPFLVRDDPRGRGRDQPLLHVNTVSPGFFTTMGIRLRDGRLLQEDDNMRKSPVAVVDEAFVRRFFPGQDVIGLEVQLGRNLPPPGRPWMRIVGVVARANLSGLEGRDGWPFIYVPSNQQPTTAFSFVVRSLRAETDITREIRERVRAIDPGLPIHGLGALSGSLDALLGNRRALLSLLGLFAGLALMLAAVGLYGVLSFDVTQRTREIGIRGALGASRQQILALVLREGLAKVMLGMGLGVVAAGLVTRLLRGMLFDVSAVDPVSYGGVILLLLAVAVTASWLPARRAAKVDPVIALRAE